MAADPAPLAGHPAPPGDPLLAEPFSGSLLRRLIALHRQARSGDGRLPLIALNGPVGAGKSTLGRQLEALAQRQGLRLVVASIDDLYLPLAERRQRLAGNPFGVSRVPPGSHDIPLLLEALERWRSGAELRLPRFDKSLCAGEGERAGWRQQPADALVLEGWLMGCQPLSSAALAALPGPSPSQPEPRGLELSPAEWAWLPRWNRELEAYRPLWQACDGLWLLRPLHWGLPRRWRFQAEARQRRAGGAWLQPEALAALVRSSLCSLPPALYQDPLLRRWRTGASQRISREDSGVSAVEAVPAGAMALLDGRRRCLEVWLQSSLSEASSETG